MWHLSGSLSAVRHTLIQLFVDLLSHHPVARGDESESCDNCLPGTKCFEKLPVSERVQAWQNLATSQAADWINVANNNPEIGDFTWSYSLPFVLSNNMRFHLKWTGRQRLDVQFPCTTKTCCWIWSFKMVKVHSSMQELCWCSLRKNVWSCTSSDVHHVTQSERRHNPSGMRIKELIFWPTSSG